MSYCGSEAAAGLAETLPLGSQERRLLRTYSRRWVSYEPLQMLSLVDSSHLLDTVWH